MIRICAIGFRLQLPIFKSQNAMLDPSHIIADPEGITDYVWDLEEGASGIPGIIGTKEEFLSERDDLWIEGFRRSGNVKDASIQIGIKAGSYEDIDYGLFSVFDIRITTSLDTNMNITTEPAMPDVPFEAGVFPIGIPHEIIKYRWYLEVRFQQHGRDDYHRVPTMGYSEVIGNCEWVPTWSDSIFGGNAIPFVYASIEGSSEAAHDTTGYTIRGTNPAREDILGEIPAVQHRAVCWQESRMRQFDNEGWPLFGGPNGWGLMQHDPPPTERHIWNWQLNLGAGAAYVNECHQNAQDYLNYWHDQAPESWSWDPHTDHPEWVWDDGFARYNTGDPIYSPNGNNGNRNCGQNQAGCDYANLIDGHIAAQPW